MDYFKYESCKHYFLELVISYVNVNLERREYYS